MPHLLVGRSDFLGENQQHSRKAEVTPSPSSRCEALRFHNLSSIWLRHFSANNGSDSCLPLGPFAVAVCGLSYGAICFRASSWEKEALAGIWVNELGVCEDAAQAWATPAPGKLDQVLQIAEPLERRERVQGLGQAPSQLVGSVLLSLDTRAVLGVRWGFRSCFILGTGLAARW